MRNSVCAGVLGIMMLAGVPVAGADVVTDANAKAAEITSKMPGTPPAVRAMAIVQVSVHDAVSAIAGRYPAFRAPVKAPAGASVDAAVLAATRTVLSKLVPAQQAAIDADFKALLNSVADGPAKTDGVTVGEQVATMVLAQCAEDGAMAPNTYRPYTAPGVYVPTMFPAVPHWGKRKTWVMTSADQFRPGPPPSVTSDTWKRDLEEIKALGARDGSKRTPEQTAIAKFWEATAPAVYWPVARSVASAPGRDVVENARLFAAAAVAMDDALVAVFDAKYAYNFWRPVTAIRALDDTNPATTQDGAWLPYLTTPPYPDYPCGLTTNTGAASEVLERFFGTGDLPFTLTAGGETLSFTGMDHARAASIDARVHAGIHFRTGCRLGIQLGRQVGRFEVQHLLRPLVPRKGGNTMKAHAPAKAAPAPTRGSRAFTRPESRRILRLR
jgi:hypothetical protein